MGCYTSIDIKIRQKQMSQTGLSSTEADSAATHNSDQIFLKWSRPHLQVLHFNDVYNIEERVSKKEGTSVVVAGASRFVTAFE